MNPTPTNFLTTDEVAERYGLDKRTVRKLVHSGELKRHNFGTGTRQIWRFAPADLDAFETKRATAAA